MDLDEVALNTLLAEGIDVPTSIAGAMPDVEDSTTPQTHTFGLAVALVLLLIVLWLLF
jgi:hypothetical protein